MKWVPLFVAMVVSAALADPVWAQVTERITPAPDYGRWIAFVIALVFGVCIVTANVWGSKRTHQD